MSKQEKSQLLIEQGFKRKYILFYWLYFKLNKFEGIKNLYFQKGISKEIANKIQPTKKLKTNNKILLEIDNEVWIKQLSI